MVQRIFWLGMHKILVKTELVRLRELGYEVFNPPYLSSVEDQSACYDWDSSQPTTLPEAVFEKLSKYNFFYNTISHEICELLNRYFDAVIVTISPCWLKEILQCYNGKVIYRTYGQSFQISKELENLNLLYNIVSRDNFWFVPHAMEAVEGEDSWIREREKIVPYCLTSDVFEHAGLWKRSFSKSATIAISCPNIKNSYYYKHYKFLKKSFGDNFYRYYGVQLSKINDSRVVGTLEREDLIKAFSESSGYLYTHTEPAVCYLPPVEMMVLGGPVLYLAGSLLDKYFSMNSPGRCSSIEEAHEKSRRLLDQDTAFINEVVASQRIVWERYTPDFVWPIFDAAFCEMLEGQNTAPNWLLPQKEKVSNETSQIYVLHHFPGTPILFREGKYFAYDGIPRVIRLVVNSLSTSNTTLVVTARSDQVAATNGFFRSHQNRDRVKILCIDGNFIDLPNGRKDLLLSRSRIQQIFSSSIYLSKQFGKKLLPTNLHAPIKKLIVKFKKLVETSRSLIRKKKSHLFYVNLINNDPNCKYVCVPHYYLFPESLQIRKNIILYLPDYMPHFFEKTREFAYTIGKHTQVGFSLVQKSTNVFCNSHFTKSYLPKSLLKVPLEKICVSYLPCLISSDPDTEISIIPRPVEGKYIFYPTQARANKNLSLVLKVFETLGDEMEDLSLVLTALVENDPKAYKIYKNLKHKKRIIIRNHVSDEELVLLYKGAAALCFTSLAEGNFPPQIHEALKYSTPVVASRLGFITERLLAQYEDSLILCEPNNLREFVDGCKKAIYSREEVLAKQNKFVKFLREENLDESFKHSILKIFNLI